MVNALKKALFLGGEYVGGVGWLAMGHNPAPGQNVHFPQRNPKQNLGN